MSFDDPHSFLFGLNQFATPTNNNSPQASGSNQLNNGNNNANESNQQNQRASALLTGFDPFTSNDDNNNLLDGGSFAELEMWTNANFSFDGPTGHALLGDEDKEKDDGDKKDEDKEEENRAGKRARNDGNSNGPGRRGKGRQRDEEEEEDHAPVVPNEPTHQTHKDQAALQQQQHYFAPPSRNADEARRPGFDQGMTNGQPAAASDRSRSTSQHEARPSVPAASSAPNGQNFPNFGQQGNGQSSINMGAFNGQQHPFQGNAPNGIGGPLTPGIFNSQQQQPGQLDLNSLLALQQLVAQNPLALASLGSFAGLNPQLGALSAQLSNLGALNGNNLQQLQQQMQQQQQQQQQQHQQHQHQQHQQQNGGLPMFGPQMSPNLQPTPPQPPFGQYNLGYQSAWPVFNGAFSQPPPTGSMAATVPTPNAPIVMNGNHHRENNGPVTAAGAPDDDDDEKRRKDRKKRMSSAGGNDSSGPASKPPNRERKLSSSDGNMSSESGGYNSKMSVSDRAKMLEERAAERDDIPPLKLIDTGNPEADAEANRLAIEEDKRKRNTAASARFRVKKKQREAALEAHTKELSTQLKDLKDEVNKLRNENQWLKGLIQVRPGDKDHSALGDKGSSTVSAPEALQAAQQLQALQQAVTMSQQNANTSTPGKQLDRLSDTGIRPRGVGTNSNDGAVGAGSKRDREA